MKIELNNLGTVNKNRITLSKQEKSLDIYFSYETPVCYKLWGCGEFQTATRQNDWSTTTGKLLNECEPDKSKRVGGESFERALAQAIINFNL